MKKSLQELFTYIWIPFILGFVFYIFRDLGDIPLAIVLLIAFSAVYTLIRVYLAHKDWRLLASVLLVIVGTLGFFFLRPQGITLSVNDQVVTGSSMSFSEGSVSINPGPGNDGKYAKGTVVSLTASPASGYDWKSWTNADGNTSNPTTVTVSGRKQVSVSFETRSALIINNQAVIGSIVSFTEGSVSVSPAPGDDGKDDGKYAKGTVVNLTASPESGYDWKSWTATDGNASNPTTVTMSGNKQITVTFQPRFSLVISNEIAVGPILNFNEGSVSLSPAPGDDDKYAKGTVVTLTANPDPAYGLKNWSGTGNDTSNPTMVTINSDKHVTVIFELRFPLTVNNQSASGPSANFTEGLVSLSPAPLADARYAKDTTVTLTASPAAGYRFDKWSGDASGNTATVTVSMSSGKNITAVFKKVYNLATSVNATGSGSVSPASGTYDAGSTVTLTASPAAGYRFDRWDGDASGNTTTVTITMNSDKNIVANFKKVYPLTTSVNPTGSGSVSPASGSYDDGATLILTAHAATGYRFDHWEGDASGNVTATVNMTASRNVIAIFNKLTP